PPLTFRRTPHGQVGFAVAIIIAGCRRVAEDAPLHCSQLTGKAVDNQPLSGAWAPESHIRSSVAVVIKGHGNVARMAEEPLDTCARRTVFCKPISRAEAEILSPYSDVGFAIGVVKNSLVCECGSGNTREITRRWKRIGNPTILGPVDRDFLSAPKPEKPRGVEVVHVHHALKEFFFTQDHRIAGAIRLGEAHADGTFICIVSKDGLPPAVTGTECD